MLVEAVDDRHYGEIAEGRLVHLFSFGTNLRPVMRRSLLSVWTNLRLLVILKKHGRYILWNHEVEVWEFLPFEAT